jgi:hypothetical protein
MGARLALAWLLAATCADAQARSFPASGAVELPVTAPKGVTRRISEKLILTVDRRVDADGIWSWEVGVRDGGNAAENLLYHSREWHGPYPTMIDAWIIRDHYFPASNELPVRGYPWRVAITCVACEVAGERTKEHFVSGTIRVRWRERQAAGNVSVKRAPSPGALSRLTSPPMERASRREMARPRPVLPSFG